MTALTTKVQITDAAEKLTTKIIHGIGKEIPLENTPDNAMVVVISMLATIEALCELLMASATDKQEMQKILTDSLTDALMMVSVSTKFVSE